MAVKAEGSQEKKYSWGKLLKGFWRLGKPYWLSEERGKAWGLLTLVILLTLASVYLAIQFNTWNQEFYDAVQRFDLGAFWRLLGKFCVLAVLFILAGVLGDYFTQVLENRWRRWMTRRFLEQWLSDKSHYLWQLEDTTTDNPDQRIAEDVRDFVNQGLDLSVGLLNKVAMLVGFTFILWNLSGPLAIPLWGGHSFTVPGYMAWVCLGYAIVGTWLSHRIGRPLIGINYKQQHFEADFRFGLVRLRENGESVALSEGERAEKGNLNSLFEWVYSNFQALIRKQMHLGFFQSGYDQIATVFPFLVAAPRYFSKTIGLGGLFQVADAFGQVKDCLSWVVANYTTLAYWRSVVERLEGFEAEVQRTKEMRQQAMASLGTSPRANLIRLEGLSLSTPGASEALTSKMNVDFIAGQSLLISGPSGCGKSTLLRTLRGIWPFTQGRVLLPVGEPLMVLPQKPYLPVGSLRGALAYPSEASEISEEAIQKALVLCRMEHFKGQLDEQENWALRLSLGEQQRVAWTRVFLHKPQWLFLDEATSALDEETQDRIYKALKDELPGTTVISVAHRQQPQERHEVIWNFGTSVTTFR